MLNTPFADWPSFTLEEAAAIKEVLLSNKVNYWTGQECRRFEQEFAAWSESRYAVALANGTMALEVALQAVGIGPGDEVVVSPRSFIASASAIIRNGGTPVFADVNRNSQNITAESIEKAITSRTRGIVCVHLAGWPCDMESIMAVADRYGLYVIEDCAQAHGARYKGRSVGSWGHAAAWSFCQDKIMTTAGEGGMLTTQSEEIWSRVWSYKDHGKSFDAVYNKEHPPGFRWLHDSFGTNGRMTEIQSAVGRIQLTRMEQWHQSRDRNARTILEAAGECPALRVPDIPDEIEHGWYKCYVFVEPELLAYGWNRDRIMSEMNRLSVPCGSGSCSEIYREKAFEQIDWEPGKSLPNSKELGETSLMFMVHPTLTESQISLTCDALQDVMARAAIKMLATPYDRQHHHPGLL
ncbi:DegT/DnrJ/EryC1/StrS family aminotransferase [Thiohalomonas denitrificans]|uniref:dTDP-4-amino-4,6-dideoxygalactose transaminase n=1 Tax=Thiohalomonas denitrificans TaxID=415747 RepID=A0A1G5QID6_9GAMM|nr:DegT/DnrJ/EryC1/StrS aminotransferase family protein [Thiohalomonas denitrificans]SCZ61452.1 dTDP-4-amino-4,6-dideoxygalactose transaminase [Thiohalomonas denitrificans]